MGVLFFGKLHIECYLVDVLDVNYRALYNQYS